MEERSSRACGVVGRADARRRRRRRVGWCARVRRAGRRLSAGAAGGATPDGECPERVGAREDERAGATGPARRAGRAGGGARRGGARPESRRIGGSGTRSRAGSAARMPGWHGERVACHGETPSARARTSRAQRGARAGEPRGGGLRAGQDLVGAHREGGQLGPEAGSAGTPGCSDLIRNSEKFQVPRSGGKGGRRGQVAGSEHGIAPAGARKRPECAADRRAWSAVSRPESTNRAPEDPGQGRSKVNPKFSRFFAPAREGGRPGIAAAGRARASPPALGRLRRETRRANAKKQERRARARGSAKTRNRTNP